MNKLILDGKEYALSDELVAKLKEEIAITDAVRLKPGAFDRVSIGDTYYCIGMDGTILAWKEGYENSDTNVYCNANYCRDREMIKQRALHETLNRLLWRYKMVNDMISNSGGQYVIVKEKDRLYVADLSHVCDWFIGRSLFGVPYFNSGIVAVSAIEEVVKPFLAEHSELCGDFTQL